MLNVRGALLGIFKEPFHVTLKVVAQTRLSGGADKLSFGLSIGFMVDWNLSSNLMFFITIFRGFALYYSYLHCRF